MAEYLIFNKDHWMDSLTQEYLDTKDIKFIEKYDARYQRGDIVEQRENGYWTTGKGFNKNAFVVVVCEDEAVDPELTISSVDIDGKLKKRRKWMIDISDFEFIDFICVIDKVKFTKKVKNKEV